MDNQITIGWTKLKKISNFVEHLKNCNHLENVKFVFDGDNIQSIKIVVNSQSNYDFMCDSEDEDYDEDD